MYNVNDSLPPISDYNMKTADSLSFVKNCSMCSKAFKSSFFINLDECGHIVCKVCLHDWNDKTENQTCPVCKSSISERQLAILNSTHHVEDHLDGVCYEKIYKSSGGILVHRVNDALLYLAMQQKLSDGDIQWVAPKGRIEGNESSLEAALREISEEAGLKTLTLIDFIGKESYSFRESGKLCKKTVFWYFFEVVQPNELDLNKEEGFIMSKWVTCEESIKTFTHECFIDLIKVAESILNK